MTACAGQIACDQTLTLPLPGTTAQAIEERFGRPSVIEVQIEEIKESVQRLKACSETDVPKVASVWLYIKNRRNTLQIALDRDGRVVCSGHSGFDMIN